MRFSCDAACERSLEIVELLDIDFEPRGSYQMVSSYLAFTIWPSHAQYHASRAGRLRSRRHYACI